MSETRHTPGPWNVVECGSGFLVTDSRGFEIVEATDSPILLGWSDKLKIDHWARRPGEAYIELSDDEYEANARLIAAAPDLLAACEAQAQLITELLGKMGDTKAHIMEALHIIQVRNDAAAAIAKATTAQTEQATA